MKSRSQLLSPSAYAKQRGVTPSRISRQIRRLGIPLYDGHLDRTEADRLIAAGTDQSRRRPGRPRTGQASESTFAAHHAQREKFKALLTELEYRQRRGELIEVAVVKQEAFAVGRQIRDALLALPDRLAGPLAAEQSMHEVHTILSKEIHQALIALKSPPA